jgi:hypothetical protein
MHPAKASQPRVNYVLLVLCYLEVRPIAAPGAPRTGGGPVRGPRARLLPVRQALRPAAARHRPSAPSRRPRGALLSVPGGLRSPRAAGVISGRGPQLAS